MPQLSIRGYARHRGVSHTAVRKALATGRITGASDGTIDPVVADEQWASSTNLSKPRNSVIGSPGRSRPVARPPASRSENSLGDDSQRVPAAGTASRLAASYADSRAAREAYLARLAKLEFEQRSGKLVDADDVRAQVFALGRRMRDAILAMPDRLAPVLVGQSEAAVIHKLLSDDIIACLAELSLAPTLRVLERDEQHS